MLSVVIPTLNAARHLPSLLAGFAGVALEHEVIVADGGSSDGTQRVATAFHVRLLEGPAGRGRQLRAGGAAARGAWLLFLHADTRLGPGWQDAVAAFIADPANTYRAAYFRLRLDDASGDARRVERLATWRAAALGLPYGDQGLLISHEFYDFLDGFQPIALMEDVELVRRIGAKRLVALPVEAVTSAERYRRDGWWARPARNLACLALWFAGVPAAWIARLYGIGTAR